MNNQCKFSITCSIITIICTIILFVRFLQKNAESIIAQKENQILKIEIQEMSNQNIELQNQIDQCNLDACEEE